MSTMVEHNQHGKWKRSRSCVYCACGERLYNGTAPKNATEQREMAEAFDELFNAARNYAEQERQP